jgi:hypothetical protein
VITKTGFKKTEEKDGNKPVKYVPKKRKRDILLARLKTNF